MKKILSLLALMMLSIVGANAETVKYALSEGDTFTSGQTVEVKNGDAVVATITYGESGGAAFKAAKANGSVSGYTAFTEGNGTNGNNEGGTFYTITPKVDATISVAVVLNANKAFYIEEDGTALENYNGIKVDEKYYGTYEFDATADKAYKVYCAGSKLGFFGFEMTPAEASETYTIGANVNGMGANMDLTLAENTTLPYTATFADCYRGAMGSEPNAAIQIQNAVVTSGTNVTIGTLNGWDTTFTISEEGTSVISLTLNMGAMTITVNVTKSVPVETKTITLVPGPWDVDGARYAAWTWSNGEDGQWIDFTKVGETYTISIPAANTGLILARMNGETTENNWNEGTLWNKTGDIDITNVPDNSVFTITGWGESDYTISPAATPLDAAKAALQAAIDKVKAFGLDGLADVIAAAEAAVAAEDATIESVTAAAAAFQDGVKTYVMGVLTTLKQYMSTFSGAAAEALKEDFEKLEADINSNDIDAVKTDIASLMVKGSSYLQADIVKLEGYAAILNNEAITADVAAMKTAVEGGSFAGLLAAVEQFKTDFLAEAPNFVERIEFAAAGYKDAGKTHAMEQLEAAIAAAKQALAAEDATIVTVGLAIRNLIVAVQTHLAANSTYTIAGTKDLTGTENDWDIVEANNMTKSAEDYMYEWTAENITVTAENQPQFKVVITDIDGTKQTWIPASEEGDDHNWVITPEVVGGEGVFNITITFNAKTQEIGVTGENTKPAQIIPNGSYYVMNMAKVNEMLGSPDLEDLMNSGELYNQLYMAAGHNWGTKGIVNDKGLDFTLTYNPSNKTYDFDSRVSNGGNNHFLSSGLWMDGPSYGWTIEGDVPDCTISGIFDGVKKYIAVDANQELVLTENADEPTAKWTFIHKSNYDYTVSYYGLEAMKAATVDVPVDATFLIKTPDFNRNDLRNDENWTIEAGNKNLKGGGDNGYGCAESYHSTFTLSQVLADAPAGVYALTAQGFYRQDDNKTEDAPVFYANEETATFPVKTGNENDMNAAGASFAAGTYAIDPIIVQVTEAGQLTIGAKGTATSQWVIWDNFQLKYYGADATIDQVKAAALMAQVEELTAQLQQLINSGEIEVEATTTNLTNLLNNVADLNPSSSVELAETAIVMLKGGIEIAEGYIKAKNVLPQMKKLTESTNFYTQEALENYYGQWYQKYEAGELTAAEANALQDPFVVTGWRANNNVDDLLMSTWDAEPMDWAKYYINTWSVEGATDGTDFAVPFFEYWTGDENSLGERVLTGTVSGLEPGTYGVSAWVRVRGKNGFTAPAYGITMQAANGEAVNAVAATAVPNSNFYVGQISAIGEVAEDGKLTLKFNVAADNNISWLSFKNVKFNKMQTFTAKFENEDTWEKVYAYTWTGGEYDKVEQLGAWPGTEITASVDEAGVYTATIAGAEAPANIIFSNGLEGEGHIQTEDFVFEDGKTYKYLIPATDITVTPETGADIYAAVEAEKATVRKVGSITIVLAQDGSYTVSAPLVAYKNLEIQANGATIDANELTGNFIEMATTEDPTVTVPVEFVSIHNATVKGLKKPLFYSSQKGYLIEWLTIDNSIVEVAADVTSIDFTKGSAVRNFNIENSTVYAPVATTKSFYSSQAGQKLTELDAEGIQSFIIKNATMYNLATGKNFFTHRQNSQKWLTYVAENNIFVNCGKKGQAIKGMNGGGSSTNPTWTISGNVFNFEVDGVMTDTSAAEETGDAEEPIQNSYALVMTFVDPAGGDFNADFTAAEDATIPTEKIGDPRWTLNYKAPEVETTYYLVGSFNGWTASDTYKLTLNENADEGVVEYMLTLDIPANSSMKVLDNLGNWYPATSPNFEVNDEGNFTVYFRPNADGDEFWFEGYIYCKYNGIPTGINSILAEAVENGKVYNLQGQKVQKTQKGLYIVNGKKQVVK